MFKVLSLIMELELDHRIGIGWNHGIGEKTLD